MAKNKIQENNHCCSSGNIIEHGFKLGFGIFLGFTLGILLVSGVAVLIYHIVDLI